MSNQSEIREKRVGNRLGQPLIVSAGLGTQHYAMPGSKRTFCGRSYSYETSAHFNNQWDCQKCRQFNEKRLAAIAAESL